MNQHLLTPILNQYNNLQNFSVEKISIGLINQVFKITDTSNQQEYILRNINQQVFVDPLKIINNMAYVHNHLKKKKSTILFTNLIVTKANQHYVSHHQECYVLMPFVQGAKTHTIIHDADLVFEAAKQFGVFTKAVSDLDISLLQYPILHFHHLGLRYKQFLNATKNGNQQRIQECKNDISFLLSLESLCLQYETILVDTNFKLRPTHHDTKISNVLFDENNKGLCLIDWDTLMPGHFISDIGDMCRTYCCSTTEEEKDVQKVFFQEHYFEKILQGYLHNMQDELSTTEKQHFVYAGKFMIYMQALRFLTDYLNNDVYYTIKYPENNYVRASNQIQLLKDFLAKESLLFMYQQKHIA